MSHDWPTARLPQVNRWLRAIVVGLCFASGGTARADEVELRRFEFTQTQMGVPFKLILYAADEATAKGASDAAFSRVVELNRILSDYDQASELSRLSATAPSDRWTKVSPDLWNVLERSQQLAAQTQGAFDVTVGPMVRLWRRARRTKEMPSDARLAEARAAVGYQSLELNEADHSVRLRKPKMQLDLGGIAMGYAVDEMVKLLRERGLTRVLIDASGDIAVGDPPPGQAGWKIGVVPLSAEGTPSRQVLLANAAISTAGDAFQHVDIGDKRYSHIVDPHTGLGLTDRTGVTVIAPDCITADGLDTAVAALGPTAGLALVEATKGAAAFIVRATDGEPETFESPRFKSYLAPSE